jgi:hypothetical protein
MTKDRFLFNSLRIRIQPSLVLMTSSSGLCPTWSDGPTTTKKRFTSKSGFENLPPVFALFRWAKKQDRFYQQEKRTNARLLYFLHPTFNLQSGRPDWATFRQSSCCLLCWKLYSKQPYMYFELLFQRKKLRIQFDKICMVWATLWAHSRIKHLVTLATGKTDPLLFH